MHDAERATVIVVWGHEPSSLLYAHLPWRRPAAMAPQRALPDFLRIVPDEPPARVRRHTAHMTRKIIAIGGGKVMVPHGLPETTAIDQEIVRLAGREGPRFLFIPTASDDAPDYCEAITRHFGKRLGCSVDVLDLVKRSVAHSGLAERILGADIIYVGGGNTLRMMKLWRRRGIDDLLREACICGKVLCGLSAGAICWFRQGNSDSRKFSNPDDDSLIRVSGLGLVDALLCPHYDVEANRERSLENMMRRTPGVAIALENCTAIQIVDDRYRILSTRRGKQAYRVCWRRGRYLREPLKACEDFRALGTLLDG